MKIRWPRLITRILFCVALSFVFEKDFWWVIGAIIVSDVIFYVLDELGL